MVRQEKAGKPLYNLVLSSLGKKYQKLGTKSFVFEREKEFFIQVMEQTFTGLMVSGTKHNFNYMLYISGCPRRSYKVL